MNFDSKAQQPQPHSAAQVELAQLSLDDIRALIEKARLDGCMPEKHPLGFVHMPLSNNGHSRGLYLHIWDRRHSELLQAASYEPIHNHTFDMTSRVLVGSLTNKVFEIIPDEASSVVRCRIVFTNAAAARVPEEPSRAVLLHSKEVHAPAIYSLRHGIYHLSVPSSDFVATLMSKDEVYPDLPAFVLLPEEEGRIVQRPSRFQAFPEGWDLIDEMLSSMEGYERQESTRF